MTGQTLSGRRIVVLGGTGGLGHEVTARFRDDGASVVVADARPPREDRRHDGVEYVTVDVLDEAAAAEGREQGVRVNCIMPSIIDTPANRAAMPDATHHRWPKPSQLAAVLAFLVSDEAILISGAAIPVYGRA